MSDQSLAPDAFAALLHAYAALTRRLSAELVAEHGLTINDYEVLLRLSRAPGGRMRRVDLAAQVLLTASGITRLLDGLEADGLVERLSCPSDRRVIWAVLTEAGKERFRRAERTHVAQIAAAFSERLSPEETRIASELLARLGGRSGAACSAG